LVALISYFLNETDRERRFRAPVGQQRDKHIAERVNVSMFSARLLCNENEPQRLNDHPARRLDEH
jgi:hypothetical protein